MMESGLRAQGCGHADPRPNPCPKGEGGRRSPFGWLARGAGAAAVLVWMEVARSATQEEVLRSIQSNVKESPTDSRGLLAVVLGVVGVLLLAVLLNQRRKREDEPKAINHPGKLLKEVAKAANLKSEELRQLKALTEKIEARHGQKLQSPLVLLLCPSLLARAMKEMPDKRGG